MCVWCPLWPVQRLLLEQPELRERPVILFAEGGRGLYVTNCSPEATQLGICIGMPLGEARSLLPAAASPRQRHPTPMPIFQRADPVADRTRLQRLAIHCQQYSPLVGLEDAAEPESLWLDISGSELLFGGEGRLVEAIRADLTQQGIQVRAAIANTWGAAWGVCHFTGPVTCLVRTTELAVALVPLPIAALRVSPKVVDSLRSLDITTIGRLMKLPSQSLSSRFGKELGRRLDQALGFAPELLTAERLIEPICAEWLFEEPVANRQALDHACGSLLERVLVELEQRRAGLRELNCHWLGTTTEPFQLRLWRPSTDRRHLRELLRLNCERCRFMSPVTGVRLEVVEMGLPPIRQITLFADDDTDHHQRLLAELVERLGNRLGSHAVLRSHLRSDPLPEFSCEHSPWMEKRSPSAPEANIISSRLRCRPLRLLRSPKPLSVGDFSAEGWPTHVNRSRVVRINGPERIESGWWRTADSKRDYYRIDLANGASLWVFCDRARDRWFLHGLFS